MKALQGLAVLLLLQTAGEALALALPVPGPVVGLVSLLVAALCGGAAAALIAVSIGASLGLPGDVLRSLAPKSVTAPVAMGTAARIGGIPALAAVFAVLTGVIGAVARKYVFDALRVKLLASLLVPLAARFLP